MADAENATRAPESDAQETLAASDNTQAPAPATVVGEHCVSDRPTRTQLLSSIKIPFANSRSFWSVIYWRNHQTQ
jgi:hypothetical protein